MGFTAASLLGKLLKESKNSSEARDFYLIALNLAPDNPEPRVALAEMAMNQGDRGEAIFHIEKALELAPYHHRANDLFRGLMGEGH
jgi:Flp pilus assembly protein TadD